jgi:hypothetical protein
LQDSSFKACAEDWPGIHLEVAVDVLGANDGIKVKAIDDVVRMI